MKSAPALKLAGDQAGAGSSTGRSGAHVPSLRGIDGARPAASEDWHDLDAAIDVMARLAEQASRIAHRGANELSMFKAFEASFAHMVEYLHHLAMDCGNADEALAKAAALRSELTARDMDALRAVALRGL